MTKPAIFSLTDSAADQIKGLLSNTSDDVIGLRIGVNAKGCSGLSYFVEYATDESNGDELVEDKGVKIYLDPMSIMYMLGTQMDYVKNEFEEGFTFINPNEKGRCGCGESFHA